MKKIFLFSMIIIPLLAFGILILKAKSTTPRKSGAEVLSASGTPVDHFILEVKGFTFSWYEIKKPDTLKLIPNFSEKLSSKDIIAKYNCSFLSNSSFYSKDNKPLGLFISSGSEIAKYQTNSLFDGILSINDMATPRITRVVPQDHLQNAIQTGPIIKENNSYITLKIQDDNGARRVLAAITGDNRLYFLVIYDKNSQFNGPLLADVPSLVGNFENESGIHFADVINLDGGAASAFYSDSASLSEINPSGAFFCQP